MRSARQARHAGVREEGSASFFGPGSDCLNIIDHRTGERRKPVLQDIVEGITVADALPNIDFVMSMVLPRTYRRQWPTATRWR